MPQLILLFAFVVSAMLTAFVIPKIILISYKKKLFDCADERKVHMGIVPRLGGEAFMSVVSIVQDLNLVTIRRIAMVTIFFVPTFFAFLNPGLMSLLNINCILLLDVVMCTLMHIGLSKMIGQRQTRMTSLVDVAARYTAMHQGKRLPFRSHPHRAVCFMGKIGLLAVEEIPA